MQPLSFLGKFVVKQISVNFRKKQPAEKVEVANIAMKTLYK